MKDENFVRFDMKKEPVKTKWYLRPVTWLLSFPDVLAHDSKIKKINMDGIKPPYIMLCNHNAFLDFKVATKAIFPHRANYVVAIDGFIGREKLLRDVGCICKRKFTNDITLIHQLKKVIDNKDIAIIYPEARYSLCGTTAVLPESLGKMCKLFKVPVVSFICKGHHVNSPFWNLHNRKVKPTEAEMTMILSKEDLQNLSVEEINEKIVDAFQYDDYRWLKEKGISIRYKNRAEGLHKVLYKCPSCKKDFSMKSEGEQIYCSACDKKWSLTEQMELKALEGENHFSHIPDWYEWERCEVRKEIEDGTYTSGVLPVHVDSLPNAKKYIRIGNGTLVHDMKGFRVQCQDKDGDEHKMIKEVPSLYSCHIEYEYLGKYGDCVDLNTLQDTWYVYPECDSSEFSVTKMALATEELYFKDLREKGRIIKKGLA